MRSTSVTVMVIFLKNSFVQSYLITAVFKVLSQQLRDTLTTAFGRHFTVEDFTEMDQHTSKSIWVNVRAKHTFSKVLCWLNIMKQILTKVPGKSSVAQNPRLYLKEHCTKMEDNISLVIECFFFLSNKSSF